MHSLLLGCLRCRLNLLYLWGMLEDKACYKENASGAGEWCAHSGVRQRYSRVESRGHVDMTHIREVGEMRAVAKVE